MSVTDANSPYSLHFWLTEFEEHNDWAAVRRTARELLHLMPDHPEALRYLAEAQFRLGETEAAHSTALRLIRVCPMCADGFWILADVYASADDLGRSAEFLEQAARRLPACDEVWTEAARAYFHLGHWGKCLVAADHGLKRNRCNVRLWVLKVFCLSHLGRREAARLAAGRLIELGVEAEDLKEASNRLGITGATLAAMRRAARGGEAISRSRGVKYSRDGVIAGVEVLQEHVSKRQPMTREEFQQAWKDAQTRKEGEEPELESGDARLEPDEEDADAGAVVYIYDRFRVWGPYREGRLLRMLREGDFSRRDAWVRYEESSDWRPAEDVFPVLI